MGLKDDRLTVSCYPLSHFVPKNDLMTQSELIHSQENQQDRKRIGDRDESVAIYGRRRQIMNVYRLIIA